MTEIKELVARLREDARQMWNTGLVPEGSTPLAEQAASAIDSLSSQVAELREALRPFADYAAFALEKELPQSVANDDATPIWTTAYNDDSCDICVGDLRQARRALASEQTGEDRPPALIQKENEG